MNRGANSHLQKWAYKQYRAALRSGELQRQPCVMCGTRDRGGTVDGHHEDYAEPLAVVWLCRLHHRWHHVYGAPIAPRETDEVAA